MSPQSDKLDKKLGTPSLFEQKWDVFDRYSGGSDTKKDR